MFNNYSSVLGVPATAKVSEIKKAYRKKAKEFHPDFNKSPNAQEQFIAVTEAYEFLLDYQENKQTSSNSFDGSIVTDEQRKERVRNYAKMRYKEFESSELFQATSPFDILFTTIYSAFFLMLLIVIPLFGAFAFGWKGLVASLLLLLVTSPLTFGMVKYQFLPHLKKLFSALKLLAKTKTLYIWIVLTISLKWIGFLIGFILLLSVLPYTGKSMKGVIDTLKKAPSFLFKAVTETGYIEMVLFVAVNIYLGISIGFQTVIQLEILGIIYCLSILATYFFARRVLKLEKRKQNTLSLQVAPFVINLFFSVNYALSSSPQVEQYAFKQGSQYVSNYHGNDYHVNGHYDKSSLIYLEGDAYDNCVGIRVFYDYAELTRFNHIAYTFEEGLLGIRVVKDYRLY